MPEPFVQDGMLHTTGDPIEVGSPVWILWLSEAKRFRYEGPGGTFGARRERSQRGGWYWKAYRRIAGHLRRAYLGKLEDLTLDRLQQAAQQLAHVAPMPERAVQDVPTLLATKLTPPMPRAGVALRSDLLQRLDSILQQRLTLVTTPGGWGKTTLLASWARSYTSAHSGSESRAPALAWLSLDSLDNDPMRLWMYVCAAFVAHEPQFAEFTSQNSLQIPSAVHGVTLLINLLARRSVTLPPIVLVMDDFHTIRDPQVVESIILLVERMPACLHLVLAGRSMPEFPLARWRASGFVREWRTDDLRLDQSASVSLLQQVSGTAPDAIAMQSLVERSEGWAAGLQLAGLALRSVEPERVGTMLTQLSGSHPYVLDYLVNEIVFHEEPAVQTFLLQTSILDTFCAELCRAVVLDSPNAVAMLAYMQRANLFLIPLDAEQHWFRYHHLFADALRAHLHRLPSTDVRELHLRAMRWYREQITQSGMEMLVAAVEHGLLAGAFHLVAELIEHHLVEVMWQRGEVRTFLRWVEALPADVVAMHRDLALAEAWGLMITIQLDRLTEHLQRLETQHAHDGDHIVTGEILAIRSYLSRVDMHIDLALQQGQHALQLLPPERLTARHLALVNLQNCYFFQGDVYSVRQLLPELQQSAQQLARQSAVVSAAGSQLIEAEVLLRGGHVFAAKAMLRHSLQAAVQREFGSFAPAGLIAAGLAEIHYEQYELPEAEQYARQAIELGERWWNHDILYAGHYHLARVLQVRGAMQEAKIEFARMRELMSSYNMAVASYWNHLSQAQEAVEEGDFATIVDLLEEYDLSQSTPLDPTRFEEYLLYAHYLLAHQQAEEARDILLQLKQSAEQCENIHRVLQCDIVLARAYDAVGSRSSALDTMRRALQIAAPNKLQTMFLRAGMPVRSLIAAVVQEDTSHQFIELAPVLRFAQRLLRKFPNNRETNDILPTLILEEIPVAEPLTAREAEIYAMLLQGLSNQAIAERLVVSVHTVKKHLTHVFAKLDVQNRVEAIAKHGMLLRLHESR